MYSTLYWLTRLDGLHELFSGILIACFVIVICAVIFAPFLMDLIDDDGVITSKLVKGSIKWCVGIGIFIALAKTFVPTKNEALLIYAGGKTWEYVQSDTSLQKLPYKATDYIKTVLENEIKEAKEEASK